MANATQIKAFIAQMAPCAINGYKTLGKVLPSVCIGMACVECGYGTAGSVKYHSYLGQKVGTGKTATKYWDGKFFTAKTKEEYTIGVHTTIKDAFRAYDSMQQCVLNYYELLNTSLYGRVKAGVDYRTQMQQIKAVGYMTSSTEVNSVCRIIENKDYNLTQYDSCVAHVSSEKTGNENPYNEPVATIKLNMRGNGVRWLQVELNRKGYKLAVDGIAGPLTIGALLDFQKKAGLVIDGLCGPATRNALLSS